jgi:hypothetical protein
MREILMVSALLPSLAACSLIPDYKRPALPIATLMHPLISVKQLSMEKNRMI